MAEDARALSQMIAVVDQKCTANANAAHTRIDKLEVLIREDLKDMRKDFGTMVEKVEDLLVGTNNRVNTVVDWMNRSKGWAAAAMLLAGIIGGAIASLVVQKLT